MNFLGKGKPREKKHSVGFWDDLNINGRQINCCFFVPILVSAASC